MKNNRVEQLQSPPLRLDRSSWHNPLVSIIITFYNYSDHVQDALLSIIDQTHENWECVIVDDCSDEIHRQKLLDIVKNIGSNKIKVINNNENLGQILTFFVGLEATNGEFVCLLDPDDRYTNIFLEKTLNAHLNPYIYCPLVSVDQYILMGGAVISSTNTAFRFKQLSMNEDKVVIVSEGCELLYTPAEIEGCHWSNTSTMMFRRQALEYTKPKYKLELNRAADSYLGIGAHMLGGTLFLAEPLVYRTIHSSNSYIRSDLFSSFQGQAHSKASNVFSKCRDEVRIAMLLNNAPKIKTSKKFRKKNFTDKWSKIIRKKIYKFKASRVKKMLLKSNSNTTV